MNDHPLHMVATSRQQNNGNCVGRKKSHDSAVGSIAYSWVGIRNHRMIDLQVEITGQCTLAVAVDGIIRRVFPVIQSDRDRHGMLQPISIDYVYRKGLNGEIQYAYMQAKGLTSRVSSAKSSSVTTNIGTIQLLLYPCGATLQDEEDRVDPYPHFNDNDIVNWKSVPPTGNIRMRVSPDHETFPLIASEMGPMVRSQKKILLVTLEGLKISLSTVSVR